MTDNKENISITALRLLIKEAILCELFTDKAFDKSAERRKRFKKQFAAKKSKTKKDSARVV